MDTWRELIRASLYRNGLSWADIIACTLTSEELDVEFDSGWVSAEGKPFTAWTEQRVYFPVVYDGKEWVGSAPRFPCDEVTQHQGGE